MNKLLHEIMVCYDISEDKVRNKLFSELTGLGLKAIQKSVFWGWVNKAESAAARRALLAAMQEPSDKFLLLPTNISKTVGIMTGGYQLNTFEYPTKYEII